MVCGIRGKLVGGQAGSGRLPSIALAAFCVDFGGEQAH
jgi:hypothetical protein